MKDLVKGLFETHLTVKNLERSITFYRDTVGLKLAYLVEARRAAFFWIGERGQAMLGIWEAGSSPNRLRLHIAFTTTIEGILSAPAQLKEIGIVPKGFHGEPVEEPVVIGWMPALSLYFDDPDGHLLEYIAMLPDAPQPALGVLSLTLWNESEKN